MLHKYPFARTALSQTSAHAPLTPRWMQLRMTIAVEPRSWQRQLKLTYTCCNEPVTDVMPADVPDGKGQLFWFYTSQDDHETVTRNRVTVTGGVLNHEIPSLRAASTIRAHDSTRYTFRISCKIICDH
jgi:hypothetical protein